MTNTLHRRGDREALGRDFVVFATPRGVPLEGLGRKLREFTRIVLKHRPVNMNKVTRDGFSSIDIGRIEEEMDGAIGTHAVFDDVQSVAAVVKDLVEADLDISINISGLLEEVGQCCREAGIVRHSVEHSFGVKGRIERLPEERVVEISSLCGHGMVSFNLIKKVVDYVKLGKLTARAGAQLLAKPCQCGVFNPTRAEMILETFRIVGG